MLVFLRPFLTARGSSKIRDFSLDFHFVNECKLKYSLRLN